MSWPTWGDTVRIRGSTAAHLRPGELAEVVGVRHLETTEQADAVGRAVGEVMVLVEFGDGTSAELALEELSETGPSSAASAASSADGPGRDEDGNV